MNLLRMLQPEAKPLFIDFDFANAPLTSSGFVARKPSDAHKRSSFPKTLKEFTREGFTIVHWDGRTQRPMVDRKTQRVIGLLAGIPGRNWNNVVPRVNSALNHSRQTLLAWEKGGPPSARRGTFLAKQTGYSYGGGRRQPGPFKNSQRVQRVLDSIVKSPDLVQLADFISSSLFTWAPNLYWNYKVTLDAIENARSTTQELKRPFPGTVFPASTLNFGPHTVTLPHRDAANLAFGWCAITSFGSFDPTIGGHLVLWDLRLVIEFPPGSTILIPSALLTHSNIRVRAHETRMSLTHYMAGQLFHWAACDHQTKKERIVQLKIPREEVHKWYPTTEFISRAFDNFSRYKS
ncbi:hypothetical protein CC1G_12955 [Coprinopsis cinerea okayama7|uniref:2OGFeDO JBP1/TET oxygenase domain-containing protein n=1 Tax=Coprinopsis cinerea (strain Okayama-7 / 130 / ATCC MYA-4618 / FGSC 9003) TaxID=240176 RepID=A8N833_COPC7|nr:hypothetical protein CC1G_12955 [Coprinopsis cinerea okayama7\|eukprot:XP_001830987.1 hypothetical protein CC1G_12955 [Coprinopsis cinerea okayama7\